ncbi:hypothetical protein VOLCADRAFT_104357 [Volvox carteri f. nagariensis]|uniref:DUF4350 domain-containing protein n=1 Tax=Volvox carteri f. nagariensis TaxID=3068 RepID=D8TT76_VOLCA|nr:uncharacterized protein VOLCADRAFT_104357 [Volvox carteri f. nagariensis]EFJ49148.1 hypothetical protein VOLCADRAFT_104357 [Volvox carteri f. nagariensis]|eukprot:XP_002949596.1 hypothetical protein VOLCADRAFT_104357 [Volvox carteri f. nagariensis]
MDSKRALCQIQLACTLGFLIALSCQTAHAAIAGIPNVAIYMSSANGVLDLTWDASPHSLELQLRGLGFVVKAADDGQPNLTGNDAPDAYVIPYQNGNTFYVSAEDMREVASYVAAGGLVILLDAASGDGAALRDFVSQALSLQGDWYLCKRAVKPKSSTKRFVLSRLGDSLALTDWAPSFLPDAGPNAAAAAIEGAASAAVAAVAAARWPSRLEDSRAVDTLTPCVHEDYAMITRPLYTVKGEEMQVAAQAFGKVGSPGAVVWLGYSWKDGPQPQWGALLKKLITDFESGAYKTPTEEDAAWEPVNQGDRMVEEAVERVGVEPGQRS